MHDRLHALSPGLANAWERASARERRLVAVAGLVIGFAAAWTWVWQPMNVDIARLQRDTPRMQAALAAARAQASELVALQRSSAPVKTGDPRAAVERVLAERALRPAVATLDLAEGRVRLTFGAVRFDALPGVLAALGKVDGLRVVDAVLTARVEPGTVRAEFTFAR